MVSKVLLPLTIAALLSNAGAVNTSQSVAGKLCAIIAPAQSLGIAPEEGQSAQPNRWQLQVRPSDLRAEASAFGRAPILVAALAMEPALGGADTRSSCYPALSFDTTGIPEGTAGVGYNTLLTANGGQPPYRWSFGRSRLPDGFSIDSSGNLAGMPNAAGTYEFNVVVSDSLRNNVTGALTLTVNAAAAAAAPVITSLSASPNVITAGGSSVLSWTTSNATTVTLNGVAGSPVSRMPVSPSATTAYVLTATNSSGSVSKTVTVTVNAAGAPVITSLSASPNVITAGGSSVLSWATSNATTVTLNGVVGSPVSRMPVSPSATTAYILTATNSSGSVSKTVTVTVNAAGAPVITSLSASPNVITAGGSSVLSWATSNATTVTLNGVGGSAVSGMSVSPSATTAYVLTATNSSGSVSKTVTVTVNAAAAPVITSLSASPNVITAGGSSVLSWTTSNATTVTLNGVGGSAVSGMSVSPSATTAYVLTATNSSGSVSKTVTVTVNAAAAPVITSLSASPNVITAGGSSVLSWTTSNATTVTLNGVGGSAVSGMSVSPSATTAYVLTATNSSGSVSKTVTVTVNAAAAPVITSLSASPNVITAGSSSVLSWTTSNATTVTLNGVGGSPVSGVSVSPAATTAYILTATNSSGSVSKTVTVTVNAAAAPVITSLSASPNVITAGSSSVLSWTTSNATTVTLNGVAGSPVSGVSVSPAATTAYTLTAINSSGSVSKSVTVTVDPTTAPTGTALTSCGDITTGGSYYLANDVSSAGTCFGIDANNITLNLNGHTITYDTGGAINSPAIEGHDSWSTTNPVINGPTGSAHGGAEIYGGNIVQAVSASSFSPVFEFGQGTFSTAPYIHDIIATFQNTGAQFYQSKFITVGARIENNTIYDNVTSINQPGQSDQSARSDFQGQAIYISNTRNDPGAGDIISGNKFIGSPQGGVYSDNQHTAVTGNDISMNARYSNDFCDAMAADYQTFENNNCHPLSGRGVHINANYNVISNNTITVTELPQNMEYGTNGQPGCEGGGAYGVQLEFDDSFLPTPPVGVQVTGNKITAVANACNALGLRVTSMTPAGGAAFTGNTVITSNSGGAGVDIGLSVDAQDGTGVTYTGNTFQSTYAYADGEWDGYQNNVIGHNTWQGTPTYTFVAADGACDPTQSDSIQVCPANFTFTDTLPNNVKCGGQSEATVTIGAQVTQCKPVN